STARGEVFLRARFAAWLIGSTVEAQTDVERARLVLAEAVDCEVCFQLSVAERADLELQRFARISVRRLDADAARVVRARPGVLGAFSARADRGYGEFGDLVLGGFALDVEDDLGRWFARRQEEQREEGRPARHRNRDRAAPR